VIQWTRTFAGDGNAEGWYVEQTTDGGYFVVGQTTTAEHDLRTLLVKTNSSGDVTWTKILIGAGQLRAYSGQQTSDGGYIVVGEGPSEDPDRWDIYLVKIDGQGNVDWLSDVSGADFWLGARGHSIVQTSDGGYAVLGTTILSDNAVILFKTDGLGRRQWFRRYPIEIVEANYDRGSIRVTSDGGYIIGTRTLLKVDSQGNQQWLKTFDDVVCANSVLQTPDGGYVATGPREDYGFIYLFKTDASGTRVWYESNLVAGPTTGGHWVEQTAAGDYVVAGNYVTPEHDAKAIVLRATSSPIAVWTLTLFDGSAACVRRTRDGGYIVTGERNVPSGSGTSGHMFLTKLAPDRTH